MKTRYATEIRYGIQLGRELSALNQCGRTREALQVFEQVRLLRAPGWVAFNRTLTKIDLKGPRMTEYVPPKWKLGEGTIDGSAIYGGVVNTLDATKIQSPHVNIEPFVVSLGARESFEHANPGEDWTKLDPEVVKELELNFTAGLVAVFKNTYNLEVRVAGETWT